MNLYLAKPDLYFFDRYNEMMTEWQASGTQIAPWFLDKPLGWSTRKVSMLRMAS